MDALKDGSAGRPAGNMKRALIFQAIIAWLAVPLPLALGWVGKGSMRLGRVDHVREHGDVEDHTVQTDI